MIITTRKRTVHADGGLVVVDDDEFDEGFATYREDYIYIYIERERERFIYLYIYIYIYVNV